MDSYKLKFQKEHAIQILNYRKPQHPPDIYFVRRNQKLLEKYLDPEEMSVLKSEAAPKFKPNYELFKLDPDEKYIIDRLINKKRNLINPNDPFFNKYSDPFSKQHSQLYDTQKVLSIISPRNHTELKDRSKEFIHNRSKELMNQICDRDSIYIPRLADEIQKNNMTNVEFEALKPQRKHDRVRKNIMENKKIQRIEQDLFHSIELKEVAHTQDVEEFEGVTNNEFNKHFETELINHGLFKTGGEESTGTRYRRSGTQDRLFRQFDEGSIRSFTFTKRYDRNRVQGRGTSTLGNQNNSRLPNLLSKDTSAKGRDQCSSVFAKSKSQLA